MHKSGKVSWVESLAVAAQPLQPGFQINPPKFLMTLSEIPPSSPACGHRLPNGNRKSVRRQGSRPLAEAGGVRDAPRPELAPDGKILGCKRQTHPGLRRPFFDSHFSCFPAFLLSTFDVQRSTFNVQLESPAVASHPLRVTAISTSYFLFPTFNVPTPSSPAFLRS